MIDPTNTMQLAGGRNRLSQSRYGYTIGVVPCLTVVANDEVRVIVLALLTK